MSKEGQTTSVFVQGGLTFNVHEQFKSTFLAIDFADCKTCILNLEYCEIIDSTGLGIIMFINEWCAERGIKLEIHQADGQVMRSLKISGFATIVDIKEYAA